MSILYVGTGKHRVKDRLSLTEWVPLPSTRTRTRTPPACFQLCLVHYEADANMRWNIFFNTFRGDTSPGSLLLARHLNPRVTVTTG